jgi:hypothetical protein
MLVNCSIDIDQLLFNKLPLKNQGQLKQKPTISASAGDLISTHFLAETS